MKKKWMWEDYVTLINDDRWNYRLGSGCSWMENKAKEGRPRRDIKKLLKGEVNRQNPAVMTG